MDIALIASTATELLASFLPHLSQLSQQATQLAAKKTAEVAFEKAAALWEKLEREITSHPAAEEAARDVAQTPEDPDAIAALRHQLKKILAENKKLAEELERMLAEGDERQASTHIQQQAGDHSIQVGQAGRDVKIKL